MLTGDYVGAEPAVVTNMSIPGAASAICYAIDINRFILIGTTNGDANPVLMFFQTFQSWLVRSENPRV